MSPHPTIAIDTPPLPPAVSPPVSTFDFIVIGSGPAGRRAAIQAAKLGRSVLVVEKGRRVGGVSVHTGTIPSKTLRETVLNLTGWRERGFYGRAYRVKKDIAAKDLMARLHMTLDHEVDVLEHQFARNAVQTTIGTARFLDPHRIEVTSDAGDIRIFQGERILIAVGTRPHRPDDVPFNGTSVFDSDEIVDIPRLPRSLTVIGAGVIGVEYATIFSALDVAVTLVEPRPAMLDFIDHELIEDFTHQLRDRGVALRFGAKVERIEFENDWPVTILEGGRRVRSEMVLYAAGRVGATDALNLRSLRPDAGRPRPAEGRSADVPDRRCRTSTAAGDVDRLPEPGLDLDGAGPHRRLPRLRRRRAARAGVLPLRHLFGAGDLHRRHERGGGARSAASPTSAASPASARPRAATSWG